MKQTIYELVVFVKKTKEVRMDGLISSFQITLIFLYILFTKYGSTALHIMWS